MIRHSIPLGRILGIPIGLDYSWFLIFAILTWSLSGGYYPAEFHGWPTWLYWLVGSVSAILLFASVLLHELGHSVVALRYQIPVRSITLFIFGGVARIGTEPPNPKAEFFVALAGPLVSLGLAISFWGLEMLSSGVDPIWGLAKYLGCINLALVLFNLIPGFPLDGGRVFRAVIWAVTGNLLRATLIAANTGRFFGFAFVMLGGWLMFVGDFARGMWIAFIGWFLESAASVQVQQVLFQNLMAGYKVSQAMSEPCGVVPADLPLQRLVEDQILGGGRRCFLITGPDDSVVGLMTLHRLKEVVRASWDSTPVGRVMLPLDRLKAIHPDTELQEAFQEMDRDGVNQLPVTRDGKVIGMLTREDVITFLSTVQELRL